MAFYRYIRTGFWQDDFISELTPEEKYFYLYLMTNLKTTQCGIFILVKKIAEAELGYSRETIEKLLKRFVEYGKIAYSEKTNEVMLLNWMKHNFSDSINTVLCINKELKVVKNKEFITTMYKVCLENDYDVKKIFKGIDIEGISIEDKEETLEDEEGPCEPLEKKEIKKEKEKSSSKNNITKKNNNEKSIKKILSEFNKKICKATSRDKEKLRSWRRYFEEDVIIEAINEAVKYKARHIGYIETVINNWKELGLTTMEKLKEHRKKPDIGDNSCNAAAYEYVD
ncbi:DnaD domain protein [Clostridium thailandense]|uniref:DnaD domain protein n=1 Tax=Clostridium thailandense TaxID=2794346 RepID=UPI00398953F3